MKLLKFEKIEIKIARKFEWIPTERGEAGGRGTRKVDLFLLLDLFLFRPLCVRAHEFISFFHRLPRLRIAHRR